MRQESVLKPSITLQQSNTIDRYKRGLSKRIIQPSLRETYADIEVYLKLITNTQSIEWLTKAVK